MSGVKTSNFRQTSTNRLCSEFLRRRLRSKLSVSPARVIDTATGELISGPVEGAPPGICSGPIGKTATPREGAWKVNSTCYGGITR